MREHIERHDKPVACYSESGHFAYDRAQESIAVSAWPW
ncbi:hypothetical protein RLDS_18975 [Sphingobium lactosutens DS20]|uniref:Uncharacterized protein n=1 Tax=Sphingobium lactosutens DS20 TaxID=1331060 RepID=T0IM75_9SPHN|nr:hypothetical protein RLDS_18975 [Sphingobium lactosutens DS20]